MSTTSSLPPKHRTTGNGTFIAAAVFMLLAAGGIVLWKTTRSPQEPESVPAPSVTEAEPRFHPPPPPPPPPPEEPSTTATPEPSASAPARIGRGGGGCSGDCEGTATPALRSALAGRGASGRRCYEKALLQNASLRGRMRVRARIGTAGQVCSAAIVSDELHDPGLNNCVLALIRSSTLPPPQGGCVDVEVPLSFVPQS